MNGLWKNCMIVKVLGRSIPIAVLNQKLREMWKPKGTMSVLDLPRQLFMVGFGEEEEYLTAWTGGPWRAFGSYLMVQAWSPNFDPTRDAIVTTPVWVRLSNLPVNFYHKSILLGIAKGLEKPVRVDATTLNLERARFARVCVEVDLRKLLKGSVMINKERYYVSYEGLSNICSNCGIYGHLVHKCPQSEMVRKMDASVENAVVEVRMEARKDDGFTSVRKSGRRSTEVVSPVVFMAGSSEGNVDHNLRNILTVKETQNISLANSFGSLHEDMGEQELRRMVITSEENKENQIMSTTRDNEKHIWRNQEHILGNKESKIDGVNGRRKNGAKVT